MNIICKNYANMAWHIGIAALTTLLLRFSKVIDTFPSKMKAMKIIIYFKPSNTILQKSFFYHKSSIILSGKDSTFLFFEKVDSIKKEIQYNQAFQSQNFFIMKINSWIFTLQECLTAFNIGSLCFLRVHNLRRSVTTASQ